MLCVGCSILSFSNCCCLFCASFRYLVGAGVGNKLLNLKQWFSTFSPGIPALECFGKSSYRKAMCEHVSTQSVREQFLKGPTPPLVACRPFDKVGNLMLGKKDSSKSSPHWRLPVQSEVSLQWTWMCHFESITSPVLRSWQLPSLYIAHRGPSCHPVTAKEALSLLCSL